MKVIRRFIALSLVGSLLLPFTTSPVHAYSITSVQVEDQRISFGDNGPVIDENGRTLVPLAKIASALNMRTDWEDETKTAIFSLNYWSYNYPFSDPEKGKLMSANFRFQIDSNVLIYEEEWEKLNEPKTTYITMDTAPRILNSRTYAPLRYLAEAAGYDVYWDAPTRTSVLNLKGTERSTVVPTKEGTYLKVADIGKKYSNYWFDFTVNSIWSGEQYNGYRADPGNKFYVFSVTETNTFDEPLPMYPNDFYIIGDSDSDYFEPIYLPGDQFMPLEFTLKENQTVTYLVAFEIPDNATTQNLDFYYTEYDDNNQFGDDYVVDIY